MIVVAQHPRRMLAEPVAQANVIAARKAVLIKLAAFLEVRRIAIDDVLAVYHGFEVKGGDASAAKQAAGGNLSFCKDSQATSGNPPDTPISDLCRQAVRRL